MEGAGQARSLIERKWVGVEVEVVLSISRGSEGSGSH